MNLGDFKTEVGTYIGRGDSLDSSIPSAVRRAARWVERNYTLQYMKKFGKFDIDKDADNPRQINFPNSRVKSFRFVRLVGATTLATGTSYDYLRQVSPEDLPSLKAELPKSYWLDGVDFLYLGETPDKDYNGVEIGWVEYTAWPTDDVAEPWLLTHAEDLMLAQTFIEMGQLLRDEKRLQLAYKQREEAVKTLLLADQELERGNTSYVMDYRG